MIYVAHIVLVLWFLESRCGQNMDHTDGSIGHLGIKLITIKDLNNHAGYEKWRLEDALDRDKSFLMANEHIGNYMAKHPEWTENDVLLFWRCGIHGMHQPNEKQLEYMQEGLNRYIMLREGNSKWNKEKK